LPAGFIIILEQSVLKTLMTKNRPIINPITIVDFVDEANKRLSDTLNHTSFVSVIISKKANIYSACR